MTEHVMGPTVNRIGPDFGKRFCKHCHMNWPCDGARAQAAEAALAEECPDCGLSVAQVGRIHIDAQMGHEDYLAAYARADKAEAALAECVTIESATVAAYRIEADAARTNAKRLAVALRHVRTSQDLPFATEDIIDAALAAHDALVNLTSTDKEATK